MITSRFPLRTLAAFCLCGAVALLLAACSGDSQSAAGKPTAVATIFSYYDALRAIGGDKIHTEILLPPNTSPHEFQATVAQRDILQNARLIVKNGLGIDDWVDRLAATSKAKILTIGQNADLLHTEETALDEEAPAASRPAIASAEHPHDASHHEEETHEGHHHHDAGNPHIWLDPTIQIKAAEMIRDQLIALDPANEATYKANADAYIAPIRQLDQDFAATATRFSRHDFIGFHAAYDYLAHRYGLKQVAAIEEVPEAGLSPAQLQKVIDLIKKDKVSVVFTEDAFPAQAVDRIIHETGVQRGILQPLETYNTKEDTYLSLMRKNLAELQRTLGR